MNEARRSLDDRAAELCVKRNGFGIDDIGNDFMTAPPIVKGVLNEGESIIFFGASQTMKTFVVGDMVLHVSSGMDWHGFKVNRCGALIVLGEGAASYSKRVYAWLKHHNMLNAPKDEKPAVWIVPRPVDLYNKPDELAELVREANAALSHPVKIVVIDTLSTNLGHGADENSTGHMASIIACAQQAVRQESGGAGSVVFVHHSGHGNGERERGSSTLAGNLDNRVRVSRDGDDGLGQNITIEAVKRKDDALFAPFCLTYQIVEVGIDADGDPITSLVMMGSDEEPKRYSQKVKGQLEPSMSDLFGKALDYSRGMSEGNVDKDDVRRKFYELHKGNEAAKRQAFSREWAKWFNHAVGAANQANADSKEEA